ncbi:MAG: thiol:disulfide interchange protein DsbA/DsbL [Deltaproteobacteria bacterium]|jgi:thiol:disulfide interchange protein DsbA|nr:thiol:disulfide interchange protein DsbA/DsbL [Deltaproteobacteria bacterium]
MTPRNILRLWALRVSVPVLAAFLALGGNFASAQTEIPTITLGIDYHPTIQSPWPLLKDTNTPLELVYIFWYGCGTCRRMDPSIDQFAKNLDPDVTFVKIPAMHAPNISWMTHARLFYALDYLGVEKELHQEVFVEVQDRGGMDDEGHRLAGLSNLDSMSSFAEKHGIKREDFLAAYNSPEVEARMQSALAFIDNLDIPSVPAMAVDGRWAFTLQGAKGIGYFFQTAIKLLNDDREALAQGDTGADLASGD